MCGNTASTGPCGGQRVTAVPTATQPIHSHLLRHYRNLLSEGENFEGGAAVTTEGDSDGAQD